MDTLNRIFILQKKKGIRAVELSQATGISESTISAWKKGLQKPSIDTIVKIATYFGVSTDWLLTGKEANSTEPPLFIPSTLDYFALQGITDEENIGRLKGIMKLMAQLERNTMLEEEMSDDADKKGLPTQLNVQHVS